MYAGSLNVRPEVRGSAIGSAMLKAVLEKEAQERTVEILVSEKNPMAKHYLRDFGFHLVEEIPNYKRSGEKVLKIERPAARKTIKKRQPAPELVAAA